MIKTLGYLEYGNEGYKRFIPLLIAVYMAHNKHAVRREQLAKLFWPHIACSENSTGLQLKQLSQHLYERFEATNHHVVVFDYTHLCDVIGLEPHADFAYVIEQLRPVNKKLKRLGYISKYSYQLDGKGISVSYTITEQLEPLKLYRHDKARHNLRVALCNLRKRIPIEETKHGRLTCNVLTDYQVAMQALQQGDLDTVLSLYEGCFLEGIEAILLRHNYELGSELSDWIESERQSLAWALQRALLQKALEAKAATKYVQMGQLARQAINLYSSYPSQAFVEECADLISFAEEKQQPLSQVVGYQPHQSIGLQVNPPINSSDELQKRK